jgi:hypothetical protein
MRVDILRLVIKLLIEEHVQAIVHALRSVVCVHFPLVLSDLQQTDLFTPDFLR